MSLRKRPSSDEMADHCSRKKRISSKGTTTHISGCKSPEEKLYTQQDVTTLLGKQEQTFRLLLEEKLREQFNMFNQLYIDNIFKEYNANDHSYIN
jgi:hypothetical protein